MQIHKAKVSMNKKWKVTNSNVVSKQLTLQHKFSDNVTSMSNTCVLYILAETKEVWGTLLQCLWTWWKMGYLQTEGLICIYATEWTLLKALKGTPIVKLNSRADQVCLHAGHSGILRNQSDDGKASGPTFLHFCQSTALDWYTYLLYFQCWSPGIRAQISDKRNVLWNSLSDNLTIPPISRLHSQKIIYFFLILINYLFVF